MLLNLPLYIDEKNNIINKWIHFAPSEIEY